MVEGIRCVYTQPKHNTWNLVEQVAKVLSCHGRRAINQVDSWTLLKKVHQVTGQVRMVFHRQVASLIENDFYFHTKGCSHTLGYFFQPLLYM